MNRCRVACASSTILGLVLGFCLPLALSGCGESAQETKTVVPEKPIGEIGKDSMNNYMQNKNQQKGAQKK
jgi:hypothetical protein